jgi:hypothetical protein
VWDGENELKRLKNELEAKNQELADCETQLPAGKDGGAAPPNKKAKGAYCISQAHSCAQQTNGADQLSLCRPWPQPRPYLIPACWPLWRSRPGPLWVLAQQEVAGGRCFVHRVRVPSTTAVTTKSTYI